MNAVDIVSAIIWVFVSTSPVGVTTHRGYVDGISPAECASIVQAFNPNTTNVRTAYDVRAGRCYTEVKQMTQQAQAMVLFNNGDD